MIYFLLPDRFSDGNEGTRPLLDPTNAAAARPAGFAFNKWSDSGGNRYQGGSIKGIVSKLDYIKSLGATTLWVGPIFKQRVYANDYHGYAIQDFLEVEPGLGTRQDLVDLVSAAHQKGLRVLLDVVFNHTADTWIYQNGQDLPPFLPFPQFYQKGPWRSGTNGLTTTINTNNDGVFPRELQVDGYYTTPRARGIWGLGAIRAIRTLNFGGRISMGIGKSITTIPMRWMMWLAATNIGLH